MLVKFFKKLFPPSEKEIKTLSYYYKEMELLQSKHTDEKILKSHIFELIQPIPFELANSCLEKAIEDNNLDLVKILHPYLNLYDEVQNNRYLKYKQKTVSEEHNNLFHYAIIAMENNNTDIFNYLIRYHCQYNHGHGNPYSEYSVNNFHYLINEMFKKESIDCFHILRKSHVFSSTEYLNNLIRFGTSTIEINNKINFVFDKLYDYQKSTKYYSGEAINTSEILLECVYNFIRNGSYEEHTQICIDTISKLLKFEANFYYEEGNNKWEIGGKEFFDMMTYLIEQDKEQKLDISLVATKCAQMKDNLELIEYFLKKGAIIDHTLPNIDSEAYKMIKRWNNARALHKELNSELTLDPTQEKPKKVNKV